MDEWQGEARHFFIPSSQTPTLNLEDIYTSTFSDVSGTGTIPLGQSQKAQKI